LLNLVIPDVEILAVLSMGPWRPPAARICIMQQRPPAAR